MEISVLAQAIPKKHYRMEKIIKIGLAVLMFGCLLNMPYGYYQLVRFIALIGFGVLAIKLINKVGKLKCLYMEH